MRRQAHLAAAAISKAISTALKHNITCQILHPPSPNLALFVTVSLLSNKSQFRPPYLNLDLAPNRGISLNGSLAHPPRLKSHRQSIEMTITCLRMTRRRVSPKVDHSRSAWPLCKALGRLVVPRSPPHPRSPRRSQSGSRHL